MAVMGITALMLLFVSVVTDYIFSCGLIFLTVGVVLTALLLISKDFGKFTTLVYICAAMIFSGILLLCNSVFDRDASLDFAGNECDVTAIVTDDMSEYDSSNAYVLKLKSVNGVSVNTNIVAYTKTTFNYKPGDIITFNSELKDNISSKNILHRLSAVSNEEYLSTFLSDESNVSLVKSGEKTLKRSLYLIRNEIKNRVLHFLPGEEGAVTVAMLIGDKSSISRKTINNFSNTGISHLFAVSGLHLSVWVMTLYYVLLKLTDRRKISEIICIVFTIGFAALTGFTASVCRAALMLTVILLSRMLNEDSDSLNSLGFSLFIILMINPMSAVSVSLLLSFSATLGIITMYPFIERKTVEKLFLIESKKTRRFFKSIISIAEISLCASIFTLPVSAFFIGSFSVLSPITNVFVSLAATLQMVCGGLCAVFYPTLFIARPLALICGLIAKYVLFVASLLSEIPYCSIPTESPYFRYSLLISIFAVICILMLTENVKKRIISIISVVLAVSITSLTVYAFFDYDKTVINVFNTGGVSVQICRGGHSVVLGCGGKDNYPDENVRENLKDNADMLIVPDRSEKLSSMFMYYNEHCNPNYIVSGENNQSLKLLRDDYDVSDGFVYSPWENASISFSDSESNSYSCFEYSGLSFLVIFKCDDKENIPYDNSDFLIVSEDMPDNFDYSKFGTVIISADKKGTDKALKNVINDKIYKLSDFDDMEIDFIKNKDIKIYCNKG